MYDCRFAYTSVDFKLACSITRRGHAVPIPNGTYVKCVYDRAIANLYAKLGAAVAGDHLTPDFEKVQMKDAGVGSILDHSWHVCPLELSRARMSAPRCDANGQIGAAEIHGAYDDMYYLVAFVKGMFWARFDWVEVVREPV